MTTLDTIRAVISPVAKDPGLSRVIVFGSYARGEQTESSDIDIVIDGGGSLRGGQIFFAIGKIVKVLPVKADILGVSTK
jgi:predicted nucleotidyltransferase